MAPKIRRQSIDSRNAPIKPRINIIINADAIIRPIISVRIVSNNVVAAIEELVVVVVVLEPRDDDDGPGTPALTKVVENVNGNFDPSNDVDVCILLLMFSDCVIRINQSINQIDN
ncbi:hypothetical protein DERP_013670 [Dermatophagoides pteronyssinus]|uniref:Uncharacterized protein n=1 Tax=Dermatophagoides pteronyssinus TaxID=6956 RepID=A0ABQ8JV64_DERPT|nr:hypothetical protein DERP_013670 [Dermatophagoides pteronyssinus]